MTVVSMAAIRPDCVSPEPTRSEDRHPTTCYQTDTSRTSHNVIAAFFS
jgi:hypothetical protein